MNKIKDGNRMDWIEYELVQCWLSQKFINLNSTNLLDESKIYSCALYLTYLLNRKKKSNPNFNILNGLSRFEWIKYIKWSKNLLSKF